MRRRTLIVAVPARDEQHVLGRCLSSVGMAADRVRRRADVHIVVAADSCTDDTEAIAEAALADRHASITRVTAGSAGIARAAAVTAAMAIVAPTSRDRVWVAMTDADSVVPTGWLEAHVAAADAGVAALVGAIAVDDWSVRSRRLEAELSDHRSWQWSSGVRPVHGANLGVDAEALATIGGVPSMALAEDAELVRRMEALGLPVRWDPRLVVCTSARRSTRAPGGFSSLLDRLEHGGRVA